MILTVIILTLLFYTSPVHAEEFTLYKDSPVVFNESSHTGAIQPFVLKDGNIYSLWFADGSQGGSRIMRMQSKNGVDWYEKKDTSVTVRKSASDPFVILENGAYTLYFASSDSGPISIWESKSTDGITFASGIEKEILKPQMPWEGTSISCPSVIKKDGTYYLFYSGSGVENWGIGLATSIDGQSWQRCANNPIIAPGASEQLVEYNGIYYLFFQSPNGLEVEQTDSLNGCETIWSNRHTINIAMSDPSPIQVNNQLWIYGTTSTSTGFHIGLAGNTEIPVPNYPVVVIPGMFASWNKDALLHNSQVSYDSWILNPSVTDYDAFTSTLESAGRARNAGYFVFTYDWRKPVEQSAQNLDTFLTHAVWSSDPYQPVQIVGHSLGGVIAKAYADSHQTKPVKQIVTVGSPHIGVLQTYKPLAGGDIERENSLMWLAEKLILLLNKTTIQTDRITIAEKIPVLFDILPTFPFLKNENGIPIDSILKNQLMQKIPPPSSSVIPHTYIGGSGIQTLSGYTLGKQTAADSLLGNYSDGHPISAFTEDGDGVVLKNSSLNEYIPAPLQNHGELIYSKAGIQNIVSTLHIAVNESTIPQGKPTSLFPVIFVFLQSPATMKIVHNGISTNENEGMIYLPNAENGNYSLQVSGTENGEYTVNVWLIGAMDDKWIQFKKQTNVGKKDEFAISFNTENGGSVAEYIAPTNTPTPTPIIRPTSKVTPKPTCKPSPTKIPTPTKKPTPTQKPHKQKNKFEKREMKYFEFLKKYIEMIKNMWDSKKK